MFALSSRSRSKLVITRRSIVLSLPFQQGFPALIIFWNDWCFRQPFLLEVEKHKSGSSFDGFWRQCVTDAGVAAWRNWKKLKNWKIQIGNEEPNEEVDSNVFENFSSSNFWNFLNFFLKFWIFDIFPIKFL